MKLPVFPNWYPYSDMVFDGHLQIGDFAVKTRREHTSMIEAKSFFSAFWASSKTPLIPMTFKFFAFSVTI